MHKFDLDKNIYSNEAVLATAYWCADKALVDIHQKDNAISVVITPRNGVLLDDGFYEKFQIMVVHNQIRHQLEEKFAPLEKVIVEKAFAPITSKG